MYVPIATDSASLGCDRTQLARTCSARGLKAIEGPDGSFRESRESRESRDRRRSREGQVPRVPRARPCTPVHARAPHIQVPLATVTRLIERAEGSTPCGE